jgi:predicted PolB exonuclease-like 3'-5' exonuclease
MIFRVLDIETIPDSTVWTPGEDQWKVVPKSKKCGDWDAQVAHVEQFPPPQAHRVVAVAWVDVVMDIDPAFPRYRFEDEYSTCQWEPSDDLAKADDIEQTLLGAFGREMRGQSNVNLVTWNGRGFDLPVLSMRSLMHGIPFGWYYDNRGMRYRYSDEGHLDLMDFLGDYGAARNMKLNDMAHLIGLPGKTDMTGASVHDVVKTSQKSAVWSDDPEWQAKAKAEAKEKMDSVGRYCLQDAIQTALIFLRTRHHLGKIDRDEYHRCLDTFVMSDLINAAIGIEWGKLRI